jgi:hypothetical protein
MTLLALRYGLCQKLRSDGLGQLSGSFAYSFARVYVGCRNGKGPVLPGPSGNQSVRVHVGPAMVPEV